MSLSFDRELLSGVMFGVGCIGLCADQEGDGDAIEAKSPSAPAETKPAPTRAAAAAQRPR